VQPYLSYYHPNPYAAGGRRTWPYTIIGHPVVKYVSLTGFQELQFYPCFDASPHVQERSNSITTIPPRKTNRFPLRTANVRGSAESIRASIGHGTLSDPSWITSIERLSARVLPEAEIDNNSNQGCLIDDETDHRETDDEENDDNDNVDPRAPLQRNIILADGVEQQLATVKRQERMIKFLFQQNTEILFRRELTSKNDKFDMTHPRRYCRGPCQLDTVLSSLRSNFRTHSHLFSDGDTDKVQYALDHLGNWSNHHDYTLHQTRMIHPITWGQNLLTNDSPFIHNFDLFVKEIQKMYGEKDRKLNARTRLYHEFR